MCILPVGLWSHESSQVSPVDSTPGWEPLRYTILALFCHTLLLGELLEF